jgi:hypothetical protein
VSQILTTLFTVGVPNASRTMPEVIFGNQFADLTFRALSTLRMQIFLYHHGSNLNTREKLARKTG